MPGAVDRAEFQVLPVAVQTERPVGQADRQGMQRPRPAEGIARRFDRGEPDVAFVAELAEEPAEGAVETLDGKPPGGGGGPPVDLRPPLLEHRGADDIAQT